MEAATALALAASLASIVVALYAVYKARKTAGLVEAALVAASMRERIARSLARAERRPRNRYIVFEVGTPLHISREELAREIREAAVNVLGLSGLIDSGLQLIEYDEDARTGILRVRNTYKYHALAILGLVRRVGDAEVMLVPLGTSGTLRRARKLVRRRAA